MQNNAPSVKKALIYLKNIMFPVIPVLSTVYFSLGLMDLCFALLGNPFNETIGILDSLYNIFNFIVVAIIVLSSAKQFKISPIKAIVFNYLLLFINLSPNNKGTLFFINVFGYDLKIQQSELTFLLPIFLTFILSVFTARKRKFDSSLLAFLICVFIAIPLFSFIEKGISLAIFNIRAYLKPISGFLIGALFPFFMLTSPFLPLSSVSSLKAILGFDPIIGILAVINCAIAGNTLSHLLKKETSQSRKTLVFSSVASLLGYSQPAFFGFSVYNKNNLKNIAISSSASCGILCLFNVVTYSNSRGLPLLFSMESKPEPLIFCMLFAFFCSLKLSRTEN